MNTRGPVPASKGRRHALAAGGAALLLPALSWAEAASDAGGAPLVLSGALTGRDGAVLSGRRIEVQGAAGATAVSDGAGRFVLRTRMPRGGRALELAVAGAGVLQVGWTGAGAAQLERDADGTWRAAAGLIAA